MKTEQIKIGDEIRGSYKCSSRLGIVTSIKKNHVVIDEWDYLTHELTGNSFNIQKIKITKINSEATGQTGAHINHK